MCAGLIRTWVIILTLEKQPNRPTKLYCIFWIVLWSMHFYNITSLSQNQNTELFAWDWEGMDHWKPYHRYVQFRQCSISSERTSSLGTQNRPFQRDCKGIKIKHEKTVVASQRKKYPARQCSVYATHKKRSEIRYVCKFCIVPLHRVLVLRFHFVNYYWTTDMQFSYNSAPKHHLGLQNIGKVAPCLRVLTVRKISRSWGI
jgi:hypothetical protein